jgi:hypothetical protein
MYFFYDINAIVILRLWLVIPHRLHTVTKYDPDNAGEVGHIEYNEHKLECFQEVLYVHQDVNAVVVD